MNWIPTLLSIAGAAALSLAGWQIHLLVRATKQVVRLMEERNTLQEDRHQLFIALNMRNNQRIQELELANKMMQHFIESHRPPESGDDADWWKRGGK